jgi:hypothetical protein
LAVEKYVAYDGLRFAPGWEELRTQPVAEVAQLVALNGVSVGCTLRLLFLHHTERLPAGRIHNLVGNRVCGGG